MLNDPSIRAFAKAVLFGTVRDVDQQNALQHYADTATDGSIVNLLAEQDNVNDARHAREQPAQSGS